jgi:hypothetical protein
MTSKKALRLWALAPALVAVACAGTRLNDVGNVPGDTAGAGGGDDSDAPGGDGTGGSKVPSTGGAGSTFIAAGAGGLPPDGDVTGGGYGAEGGFDPGPDPFDLQCDGCEVVAEAPDIRAIAIGSDHVFWLEYGSKDSLGNYQDDGRLLSLPLAGGESATIAADLQGPIELTVSDEFAYAIVEQSSAANGPVQLVRIALDTGETKIVQRLPVDTPVERGAVSDWFRRYFVTHDGVAFWVDQGSINRLDEDSAGLPEAMQEVDAAFFLTGDSSQLYLYDAEGIKALPYTGGTPTLLRAIEPDGVEPQYSTPTYWQLQIDADFIYAHEAAGEYVVRMPVAGGAWQRLEQMSWQGQLIIDGERYFRDPYVPRVDHPQGGCTIQQASFNPSTELVTLAKSPCLQRRNRAWRAWDVAPSSVYFGWDGQLYRVPRAEP